MKTKTLSAVITASFLLILFTCSPVIRAQEPAASPTPASANKGKAEPEAKPAAAKPEPTPEPDVWHRETMTGDWGGTRSRWAEKGVELEFRFTSFYQGVADGGISTSSVYNGKINTEAKLDLGKLWGWKFWSAQIDTEFRFGGPLLKGVGTINPVNTAAMMPAISGTVFAVGTVSFTRLIPIDLKKGNLFAVSFGRFNMLDLIDEDFFAGSGEQRFLNIAQNGPLTVLREVPFVTNGATFAYVRHGEPIFTIAIIDPNDHSVDPGLADLFADGVSFVPAVNFPTKYFGKSGKHTIGGAITTKAYTPFDSIRQVILPGPPIFPIEKKRGSWSVNYTFRQYFVERAPKDGWGLFTQVSYADKDTSPVTVFFDMGLGGNGLFKARRRDEFGISYAYTNISSVIKDNIEIMPHGGRLQSEHQVEAFYNFFITPWLRLTGDLQVIRPTRRIADIAVVPGARLEFIF